MKKIQKTTRYCYVKNRKINGAHYTPKTLADFVAEEILQAWNFEPKTSKIRVLDPAVGDGELLLSILNKLSKNGYLNLEVFGFDTDPNAIQLAIARIKDAFPKVSLSLMYDNFLDFVLKNYGNSLGNDLFTFHTLELFDLIIANPPYVRTQILGAAKAQMLARQFGLSGRVDLYYAFILGIAQVLKPDGTAGIIVSNRFMTTKSGSIVRKKIIELFDVLHVWDLGDTQLFEAAVLPAVLLVKRKNGSLPSREPKITSIYSTENKSSSRYHVNIIEALKENGVVKLENGQYYYVQHGILDYGDPHSGIWRIANEISDKWISTVKAHTFCTFGDIGKVRVGVKTTADKVFIRSDWDDMPEEERPELLKPLITHDVAREFKAIQPDKPRRILYTHQVVEGKRVVVNLDEFPRTAKYLNRYRSILEKREYVLKAGRKWFEIWVHHDPNVWKHPKIVFRDISEKPCFWMDLSRSIVNGDCYWLTCEKSHKIDLLWLALSIGNSSFVEVFYDHQFNNKLYSGRRRFMTQYVEKFPLPDPETELAKRIIQVAKEIYDLAPLPVVENLKKELDQLVWQAFGFSFKKINR